MKLELNVKHFNNEDVIATSSLCLSPDLNYNKYKYYGLSQDATYLCFVDDEGDMDAVDEATSYSYNGSAATISKPSLTAGCYYHLYVENNVLYIYSCNDPSHNVSDIAKPLPPV